MTTFIFLLGVFVGIIVAYFIIDFVSAKATLQIDHSNPEKDLYRLDLDQVIEKLDRVKYLRLRINHYANLSDDSHE